MADDTTVVNNDDSKFVPEPVPDTLADIDISGLNPAPADETAEVEDANGETTEDQPEDTSPEPVVEAEEPETTETEAEPEAEQPLPAPPDVKEQARQAFEQRQQAKAQRDYVAEERQKIREYEQNTDTSDVEERMKVLEAKQYIDTVERNRASIASDVSRAQSDIPFFKSGTEQSQRLFNQSLENFANAYGVIDPQSGEWIAAQDRNGNDIQLLPYLQQQAATYEQILADTTATAGRQAQQSEAKMRAKAVNPSNVGKVTSSGDELADLLDRIGDVQLAG